MAMKESSFEELPVYFEENQGQTDDEVKYLSRGFGYNIFLTADGVTIVLNEYEKDHNNKFPLKNINTDHITQAIKSSVIKFSFVDANPDMEVIGGNELAGKVNYFRGDSTNWLTDIPTYVTVAYRDVYPGIDFYFYGKGKQLRYPFWK